MSFKQTFETGGEEFIVVSSNFGFMQTTDETGRPSSVVRGGKVEVILEGSEKSRKFFGIAVNSFERIDFKVVNKKRDTDATMNYMEGKEAYIVGYKETFDANGPTPYLIHLVLSANILGDGTAEHGNSWV